MHGYERRSQENGPLLHDYEPQWPIDCSRRQGACTQVHTYANCWTQRTTLKELTFNHGTAWPAVSVVWTTEKHEE